MLDLKVSLFGKLTIEQNGRMIQSLPTQKAQELFCYLLIRRQQAHSRETLAELLWEGLEPGKAKKNLRQTLWRIQSNFGGEESGQSPLGADSRWIRFVLRECVSVDIFTFEETYDRINSLPVSQLSQLDYESIQAAVKLYRGDFLDGWYQNWCIIERERYQRMYLMLLDKLVQYCEHHRFNDIGIAYGAEILRIDQANERTHRQMIRMYYMAGDRSQAIHQYDRCVKALRDELGVGPSDRTVTLYEQVCSDQFKAQLGNIKMSEIPPEERNLNRLLDRLESFSELLNVMQRQVQMDINTIEHSLQAK